MEHGLEVGLVSDLPTEQDAWREVDRRTLLARINEAPAAGRIRFDALAEHYLRADFGEDAIRPKASTTMATTQLNVRKHLIPRWGGEIAEDIKSLDVQRWLKSLNTEVDPKKRKEWSTISKIRGTMDRIYKVGMLHELVSKNPVEHVESRSKSDYEAINLSPQQTLATLQGLPNHLHHILVLTCAATALRASEILALRWSDIVWGEGKIRVSKRWKDGKDGKTKTKASNGYVPLHPVLAAHLQEWRTVTPYSKETDFIFPSFKSDGSVPLSASVFVADHLRPAAIKAGVQIPDGYRFGLHNLRHSLSSWLVNKAKVDPKTVQGMLRHSRIGPTLDLYTQQDPDNGRAAQGQFLEALGVGSETSISSSIHAVETVIQ